MFLFVCCCSLFVCFIFVCLFLLIIISILIIFLLILYFLHLKDEHDVVDSELKVHVDHTTASAQAVEQLKEGDTTSPF